MKCAEKTNKFFQYYIIGISARTCAPSATVEDFANFDAYLFKNYKICSVNFAACVR